MTDRLVTRRAFIATCSATIPLLSIACSNDSPSIVDPFSTEPGRLRLQARSRVRGTPLGNDVLYGEGLRRAYIRVPPNYSPSRPAPLVILFHGASARADLLLAAFASRLDAWGAIGLAPDAVMDTWDVFEPVQLFTSDIPFVNLVLDQTFDRCAIDTTRVALLGFSDGASYAITLGLANADQLSGIVAFSPGTFSVDHPHGTTQVFTAHGDLDPFFSAENATSIDTQLRARQFTVTHVEFSGGHEIPDDVADQAFSWLAQRQRPLPE
jgi:phospholipase/carboxylesterase